MSVPQSSACQQCGATVRWVKEQGKWRCLNIADAHDHWDACSKRRWQQVKATGERFETSDASGYANSVHGTKFDMQRVGPIRGAQYVPVQHRRECAALPWEDCACQ